MDEAEKYKQRLEAIAEKRRLLDEQERAKREMEDERIRLQQLKRKSLRDQWLMEGPPLSPSSLDTAAPHSPLWGTQAQETEKRFEKLESQIQQLVEGEEKLTEEMEDGQIETVAVEETAAGLFQDVEDNGKNGAESSEEIQVAVLTNGAGGEEEDMVHSASVDVLLTSNGLSEDIKSDQVVHLNNNIVGEEEEGTLVIRAECIMITDEGDDTAEEDTKENGWENAVSVSEETQETVIESGQIEGRVTPTVAAGQSESAIIQNGVEEDLEKATASQLQTQTQEGALVVSVPVYSETQPCITTTQVEVENEDFSKEETIEVVSKPNIKVEFQEVPLSEPQGKKTPGEQEPFLPEVKSHDTDTEKAGTSNQTESPNRADQAETKMTKRKTCQCCSVM